MLFAAYLVDGDKKESTVKSYISAIKTTLKENNIQLSEDTYLLNSLTRACKFNNTRATIRLPIHKDLLHLVLRQIDQKFLKTDSQPHLATLYKAIFATRYYRLFRIGEITKGTHLIQARDVHIGINKQKILFMLRTSKTHWKDSMPQSVKISSSNISKIDNAHSAVPRRKRQNEFCPYTRGKYKSSEEPFFIYRDGMPVSAGMTNKI